MANLTILFADDSATMRQIMEKTFAAEPVEVVAVPSGEAAIAKAIEVRPSVIIADAGMPGVNGYELCRTLRQDPALAEVPVLILGGVSSPYDEAKGREAGVTESMKKPFDTTKLIEKVNELAASAPAPAVAASAPAVAASAPATPTPIPAPAPAIPKAPPAPPMRPPAFPARPAPVGAPVAAAQPARPIKETMEFAQRPARPAEPEVRPIELEPIEEEQGSIQVGTLAELAQMDSKGGPLATEVHEKAIDLTPAAPVQKAVAAATPPAAEVVAKVGGGLTAEQVEAIRRLTAEVVERVVWEVVPDLAEAIIQERLSKLLEE